MNLKLNLGCGKTLIQGPGWLNVDRAPSTQRWEESIELAHQIASVDLRYRWPWLTGSIELITLSHLLYCMTHLEKFHVLSEACRVLNEGGILRITEDDNFHPQSLYYEKLHHNSVERTSKKQIVGMLQCDGFKVTELTATETQSEDKNILLDLHPDGPAIFFLEATRI